MTRDFRAIRRNLGKTTRAFIADQRGATAIEYALLGSLLSIAIISAMLGVSGGTGSLFEGVFDKVYNALVGGG